VNEYISDTNITPRLALFFVHNGLKTDGTGSITRNNGDSYHFDTSAAKDEGNDSTVQ